VLSLQWQGDSNCDRWYAFKASSEVENTGEDSVKRFKLAGSILSSISGVDYDDIGAVIAKLDCERMVEDRRIGEWLKIEDVKPETWHRYMSIRDGSCECAAIAPDGETAVKMLIKSYAKNMESGYGNYADKLQSWIKDGSPVKLDDYAKCPCITDLAELIKPMKEKVESAVAQSGQGNAQEALQAILINAVRVDGGPKSE